MFAYAIAVGLILGQAPDIEETAGRIETVNKTTKSIGVRDVASSARKLYYFNKESSITREGKPAGFDDLHIADTVSMKWVTKGNGSNQKRFLERIDVRHILMPGKLKVQEIGFLPLQDDTYHFVVLAQVDPETVLVQERVLFLDPKRGTSGKKGLPKVNIAQKEGEEFFLREVKSSDFPVGKRVSLGGKWQVKTSESTQVTKSGVITTKKVNTAGNAKSQDNLNKDRKSDNSGQSNRATSNQIEKTKNVSGFVLVPVKSEEKAATDK
jgi:hypothetical protein